MGEHIDQYQNIARLFRRLADAFDALGSGPVIVAKDGNLKPKAPAPSAEDTPAENEIPF